MVGQIWPVGAGRRGGGFLGSKGVAWAVLVVLAGQKALLGPVFWPTAATLFGPKWVDFGIIFGAFFRRFCRF